MSYSNFPKNVTPIGLYSYKLEKPVAGSKISNVLLRDGGWEVVVAVWGIQMLRYPIDRTLGIYLTLKDGQDGMVKPILELDRFYDELIMQWAFTNPYGEDAVPREVFEDLPLAQKIMLEVSCRLICFGLRAKLS